MSNKQSERDQIGAKADKRPNIVAKSNDWARIKMKFKAK